MTWAEERALAKKRARVLSMTKPEEVSVEQWLSSYLGLFPSDRSEKAERTHLSMLRAFRRAHGEVKVCEVTPLLAQSWALENRGQVTHLSRAWRKAVLMGVAEVNVWRLVTLPRREKERVRPPTDAELGGILAACEERGGWWEAFADLIVVAAYTGAREGGLVALRHSAVDVRAGRFTVTEKGEKTRSVVLCGPAGAAMGRQVARRLPLAPAPARFMVWLSLERRPLSPAGVQKAWREVRGDFPHGFHSLRHHAATWLAAQGADRLDIAVQLGHVDGEGRPYERLVQRVYNHPDPNDALDRIARLA